MQDSPKDVIKPIKINEKQGLRLLGFPKTFEFPEKVVKTQRMKQLGNSVAVTAVQAWGNSIIKALDAARKVRP